MSIRFRKVVKPGFLLVVFLREALDECDAMMFTQVESKKLCLKNQLVGNTPYPTSVRLDVLHRRRLRELHTHRVDRQNGSPWITWTAVTPLYLLNCCRKHAVLSVLSSVAIISRGLVSMARALQSSSWVGVGRQNWPQRRVRSGG